MDANWLWAIPAFPLAGAALNGLIAVVRRWTPGDPLAAGHGDAGQGAGAHRAPTQPADTEPVAPSAGAPKATRIRLPGEPRVEEKPPLSVAPTHAPAHAAHGPNLTYAGWIACAAMLGAFAVAAYTFTQLRALPVGHRELTQTLFPWIRAGLIDIPVALFVDPLSALMILVVTGVGFLIHVYSLGYMAHDENPDRYFTYLNLFAGMMLILVLGNSLPLLFVGWEGVGLCSYLLIGFWYSDLAKAQAGKKAFVVNRVGDFGFLLGMFTLFAAAPQAAAAAGSTTLSFATLTHAATLMPLGTVTAACLLLFVGACGKSAQFPLYIWLPDAMAGPTPVSALIHAATMVTAGVYMIARLSFLYSLSPQASAVVATVGAFTAIFAATMAFVQNDVKKVLAYSTVSQLGFMVLAVGSGGYGAGVYHLMTHAFFKACLFLGAGSLIHSMEHALPHGSDPNDIRSMGGLRTKMPLTFVTFAVAWLAIIGCPPFAGFFSKDEILASTLESPLLPHGLAVTLFLVALIAAGGTAFYMTRLVYLVFFGKPRMGEEAEAKIHDSPATMTVPMAVLALASLVGGFLWAPILKIHVLEEWLAPSLAGGNVIHPGMEAHAPSPVPMLLALGVVAAGFLLAHVFYKVRTDLPGRLATWMHGGPYRLLWGKYFVDEAVEGAVVEPVYATSRFLLWRGVDAGFIDGIVNGVGSVSQAVGGVFSRMQTGVVQNYAVSFTLGVAAIAIYLLTKLHG